MARFFVSITGLIVFFIFESLGNIGIDFYCSEFIGRGVCCLYILVVAVVVRCVGNRVTRLDPTATIVSYGKLKCTIGVSLGACSTVRNGDDYGLCVCRTVHRSTCILCNFTSGRRQRLFLLLVSISNVKKGATHVVLSTLSPTRLIGIVDARGTGVLGAIGNVKLGATRHIVISLGSGVGANTVTTATIKNTTNTLLPTVGTRMRRRTVTTLAVLKFTTTPSRGTILTVLGRRPSTPIRGIVGLTLGEL